MVAYITDSIRIIERKDKVEMYYYESPSSDELPMIIEAILDISKKIDSLTIFFNSKGGEVTTSRVLIRLLKDLYPGKITGIVTSLAGSMAAEIFLECDYKYMYKNSSLLVHLGTIVVALNYTLNETALEYLIGTSSDVSKYINILTDEELTLFKAGADILISAEDLIKRGIAMPYESIKQH